MPNAIKPSNFQQFLIKRLGVDKYLQEYMTNKNYPEINVKMESLEQYRLKEYKMWYQADPAMLEFFYKSNHSPLLYENYNFWRVINTNMVRAHYPLASAISGAFGTLLFNDKPKFSVVSKTNQVERRYKERLQEIIDQNDMLSLLQEAAKLQSYSGAVAMKLNLDSTVADVPLITLYPKGKYVVHKKYNQVMRIDFVDDFDDGYQLISHYGYGFIHYTLLKNNQQVPLTALEQTKGLEDVMFVDGAGNLIPIMFGELVPNKAGEKSDYDGLVSMFHAMDETYSSMVNYIRKTKPHVFITEDLAPKDASGKAKPFNEFDNVVTVLDGSPSNEETNIERDVVQLSIQGYKDALESTREMVLTKVNLSPGTLGLPSGGGNESSLSLNIRERASYRARSEKLAIWEEKLDTFLYAALILDFIVLNGTKTQAGAFVVEGIDDFAVSADFGDNIKPTMEEKIQYYAEAIRNRLVSVEFAISQIYGDRLTDTELMFLIIQTKQQNNIPLSEEELEIIEKDKELKRNKFTVLNFRDQ